MFVYNLLIRSDYEGALRGVSSIFQSHLSPLRGRSRYFVEYFSRSLKQQQELSSDACPDPMILSEIKAPGGEFGTIFHVAPAFFPRNVSADAVPVRRTSSTKTSASAPVNMYIFICFIRDSVGNGRQAGPRETETKGRAGG